jgi:sialidase-1
MGAAACHRGQEGREKTVDNASAVVDQRTGRIHFLYQTNYARVWHMHSDDDGATFSEPADITPALDKLRPGYDWTVAAPGPGHGLQMAGGRLIIPVWLSNGGGKAHRPSVASVLYSDDNGAAWKAGDMVPDTIKNPSETAAVQLEDGRVMLFMRNENTEHYTHAISSSKDGATGWTPPEFHPDLYSPICFATAIRLSSSTSGDEKSRLLFAHPNNPNNTEVIRPAWGVRPRERMTVRVSYDEGKTWPVHRMLSSERCGYADLAIGADGMIYCLYERGYMKGNNLNTRYLSFARFNLEWLSCGADSAGRIMVLPRSHENGFGARTGAISMRVMPVKRIGWPSLSLKD